MNDDEQGSLMDLGEATVETRGAFFGTWDGGGGLNLW